MKKFLFIITIFIFGCIIFSTPSQATSIVEPTPNPCNAGMERSNNCPCSYNSQCASNNCAGSTVCSPPTPTPTIEPLITPATVEGCPDNGTIYPPNSVCYSKVKKVESIGINLFDSNEDFLTYILSCIPGPNITYNETLISVNPPNVKERTVSVNSNFSEATLGFLGPNSTTLNKSNPDTIAKKYLFNALFDRPGTDPNAQRESFRTFWRMLSSVSQAQLKAYYIEKANEDDTYYYVDRNKKQQKVVIKDLKKDLTPCLKRFGLESEIFFHNCWRNNMYNEEYLELVKDKPLVAEAYDALLPFDFNNSRAYLSNGSDISEENIPYLRAILSGLKGYRSDIPLPIYIPGFGIVKIPNTVIPGLFDYYTPEWAIRPLAIYPTIGPQLQEELQKIILNLFASANKFCPSPPSIPSISSPKTFPDPTNISYSIKVPVTTTLVSSDPGRCQCNESDANCYEYQYCNYSYEDCPWYCLQVEGADTYNISGSTIGKPITVFNNPNITNLTDLVLGGKQLVSNTPGDSTIVSALKNLINKLSDKLISPIQPSFYKMLLPDFASESATPKKMIGAPSIGNSGAPMDNKGPATVTVAGGNTIYRENNLAQDTMHLLQNCWLVPSEQQSSSKCGKDTPPSSLVCSSCDPNIPDATTALSLKPIFLDLATRWLRVGHPAVDKFETVINSSVVAGINPIFALTIWLNESNASNYDGVCEYFGKGNLSSGYCNHLLDFGINLDSIASNYAAGEFFFSEQLSNFLGLPNYYKSACKAEMEKYQCPMRIFAAMFRDGNCEPSGASDSYLANIEKVFGWLAPDQPFPCYPSTYP